jgi:hypothetical protein
VHCATLWLGSTPLNKRGVLARPPAMCKVVSEHCLQRRRSSKQTLVQTTRQRPSTGALAGDEEAGLQVGDESQGIGHVE